MKNEFSESLQLLLTTHLTLIVLICGAVMGPSALMDRLLQDSTKEVLFSRFKSRNYSFLKNRDILLSVLNSVFLSRDRQISISNYNLNIVYPSWHRFLLLHFTLVSVVAWTIIPGSEPIFHETHPKAEITGWVISGYQIHTMIFIEWGSLYITTLLLSFPLDYISATKTLSIARWSHNRSRTARTFSILLDVVVTALLVSISLVIGLFLFFELGLDLPEYIYQSFGGAEVWLIHEDGILDRISHAALVIVIVTGLVVVLLISLHVASLVWFILSWFRVLRVFSIRHLKINVYPFTVAGLTLCIILLSFYIIIFSISAVF